MYCCCSLWSYYYALSGGSIMTGLCYTCMHSLQRWRHRYQQSRNIQDCDSLHRLAYQVHHWFDWIEHRHDASPTKATLQKTASLSCVVPTCRALMASLLPSTAPIAYKGCHSWQSFSKTKQRLCRVCNGWRLSANSQRRSLHCSGNLPQRFCRILQCTVPVD